MFNVPCRDASLRYVSYVRFVALYRRPHSDASGRTGALPAGLLKRRAGRPSGLHDASTPVRSLFPLSSREWTKATTNVWNVAVGTK